MYVEVNLSTTPPLLTLEEPDDLKSLKLVVRSADHAFIAPEELLRLAGARAQDPAWREQFEAMLAYAKTKGWTDESGSIRAHIEEI